MQLIMEYYSMDYAILMDYIEDVVIIENPDEPTGIHLYQVKTKSTDKQYLLTTVIKDEWFQKLYKNAQKYAGNVLLVGINYSKKEKKHECMIEEYLKK